MRYDWNALRELYVRGDDELTLETLAAGAAREMRTGTGVLLAAGHSSEECYHRSDAGRLGRGLQQGVGSHCWRKGKRAGEPS